MALYKPTRKDGAPKRDVWHGGGHLLPGEEASWRWRTSLERERVMEKQMEGSEAEMKQRIIKDHMALKPHEFPGVLYGLRYDLRQCRFILDNPEGLSTAKTAAAAKRLARIQDEIEFVLAEWNLHVALKNKDAAKLGAEAATRSVAVSEQNARAAEAMASHTGALERVARSSERNAQGLVVATWALVLSALGQLAVLMFGG